MTLYLKRTDPACQQLYQEMTQVLGKSAVDSSNLVYVDDVPRNSWPSALKFAPSVLVQDDESEHHRVVASGRQACRTYIFGPGHGGNGPGGKQQQPAVDAKNATAEELIQPLIEACKRKYDEIKEYLPPENKSGCDMDENHMRTIYMQNVVDKSGADFIEPGVTEKDFMKMAERSTLPQLQDMVDDNKARRVVDSMNIQSETAENLINEYSARLPGYMAKITDPNAR